MEIVKAFNDNEMNTEIVIKGTYEKPLFRASDVGLILGITYIHSSINNFDETEKVVINTETLGGMQNITFLTTDGLYSLMFTSRKPIAKRFKKWVCKVIEEIRLTGKYEDQQRIAELENRVIEMNERVSLTEEENKRLREEAEDNQKCDKGPSIYLYNTDIRLHPPELKIGYTINAQTRIKSYKQSHKFGKLEHVEPIITDNIKIVEGFIHLLLKSYRIQDEVFKLEIDEAKIILLNIVNLLKTTQITNPSERRVKLSQLFEKQSDVIDNEPKRNISVNNIGSQTDFEPDVPLSTPLIFKNEIITNEYQQFFQELCIVRPDVEIQSTKIFGQFRLWSRIATKERYDAFKNYLDTHFKYGRLRNQDRIQSVNGYIGITLKEMEYKKSLIPCEVEQFVFNRCKFSPEAKSLTTELVDEFIKWKTNVGKEISYNEKKELGDFLKKNKHVLFATIWTNNGNGQGYYGISIKHDHKEEHYKTSSTGKKVEKRNKQNELLGTWETIVKAALFEKIAPVKMSRSIKNKTVFHDDYYYCLVVN